MWSAVELCGGVVTIEIPQNGLIVHIIIMFKSSIELRRRSGPAKNQLCGVLLLVISYDHRKHICHGYQKSFADTRLAPLECRRVALSRYSTTDL